MGVGWFRCFRLYSPPYALEIVFSLFFFIATIFKWLAFRLLFAHKNQDFVEHISILYDFLKKTFT